MVPMEKMAGWDCRQKSLANIVRYKQYPHYKTIWKQCGTFYAKYNAAPMGMLHHEYLSLAEELQFVNNITLIQREQMDGPALVDELQQLVGRMEPVVVYIDTFGFKDNIYYQKDHFLHTITLIDYQGGRFTYIDDTYDLKAELSPAELLQAAVADYPYEGILEEGIVRNYLYISTEQAVTRLDVTSLFQVMQRNNACLQGTIPEEAIWKKTQEVDTVIVGLSGIQRFITEWTARLHQDEPIAIELLVSLYADLLNASHTRHKYATFLLQFSNEHPDIERLSSMYQDLAGYWHTSANQALKAVSYHEAPRVQTLLRKLLHRLERVLDGERSALELGIQIENALIS